MGGKSHEDNMENEYLASVAPEELTSETQSTNPEGSTTEGTPEAKPEDRISKVEQRIRKLANEKNEYRDEVMRLREELLQMTAKPLVEPKAEDFGGDIDAFVNAKLEFNAKKAEEARSIEAQKLMAAQQAQAAKEQSWQSKIDALPADKRSGYYQKVTEAQKAGKLDLPEDLLLGVTESLTGPEVILELIENPALYQAVQNASKQEAKAILDNAATFFASKRFNLGKASQVTQAPPATPAMGPSTPVVSVDPRKMDADAFRRWYRQNRK